MQNEQARLSGQQAELQRRLAEAELRGELDGKAMQQEVNSAKSEVEFLRHKLELYEKESDVRKQEYERVVKELEQRYIEVR